VGQRYSQELSLPRPLPQTEQRPEPEPSATGRRIGPSEVRPEPLQGFSENVLAGYDDVLGRPVWVVVHSAGAALLSPERQQVRRPGQLRWLGGGRSGQAWDAFEAVEGRAFVSAAPGNRGWGETRAWR
jgi:hypothetical protein